MPIFNSLGSNYNFSFATKALFAGNDPKHSEELEKYLQAKYQGKPVLLYKAREAIFLALKILNLPKGSLVAINGYTCYAVYKAIVDAGYKPEYLDIIQGYLNFSAESFKRALENNPSIKVLMIQNTLGYVCDIPAISEVCKSRNIILIEDLAHSIGSMYQDGREAGTVGDFTALSFSQDKTIDTVSGGALIIRNEKYQGYFMPAFESVDGKQQLKDRWYPMLTYKIRKSYFWGLGKLLHKLYKNLGILSQPMGKLETITLHKLPAWYSGLVFFQFQKLEDNLKHRKEIAEIYKANLSPKVLLTNLLPQVSTTTNLRFPISIEGRDGLVAFLKKQNINVSDIWYDAPVAPEKYMRLTDYHNQCPEAEKLSKKMLNLPTHINVNVAHAKYISEKINQWQTSQ